MEYFRFPRKTTIFISGMVLNIKKLQDEIEGTVAVHNYLITKTLEQGTLTNTEQEMMDNLSSIIVGLLASGKKNKT